MDSAGVRRVVWGGFFALVVAIACAPASVAAPPAELEVVPGELIVGYHAGVDASAREALRGDLGLRRIRALQIGGRADLVAVGERSLDALQARAAEIARSPRVAYAEPNWYATPDAVPSDDYFAKRQWSLRNIGAFNLITDSGNDVAIDSRAGADIDATHAWDITTGNPNVVVGIVDTGVDAGHQDLDQRIWTNPGEVANGLDDDGNGVRDDVHGADLIGGPADNAHGTHVAGIVGGEANGAGTVGVAWNTSIMPVRAVRSNGSGDLATAAEGVRYAAANGARIVNMSFGSSAFSTAMAQTIIGHPQTLFVASAGNNARNTDWIPYFPCSIPAPNLVCVASSNPSDGLSPTSSYGPATVELAAPGELIMNASCCGSTYAYMSGTSMAAAEVSGIAALMAAAAPWAGPAEQKECLMTGATEVPGLTGRVRSGGRANATGALRACGDRVAPEVAPLQVSPRNGARVRAKGLTFEFTPGRDSLSGVVANTVLIDGKPVAASEAVAAGTTRAKVRSAVRVRDGRHRWLVRSSDRFGNHTDSTTRTLFVDGSGPGLGLSIGARSAKRGVRLRLRLSEAAKVSATLGLARGTLKAKRSTSFKKGRRTLTIRLPKRLRAKAKGKLVEGTVRATDKLGNVTRKRFTARLR